MQIKKITFNAHGLRGATIEYSKRETTSDGRPTTKTVIEKKQTPVQLKLEILAKSLRINMLEICRVLGGSSTEDDAKFLLQETEITKVEIADGGFVLHGTLLAFEDKNIKLKTPKVEEADGYHKFDQVQGIITEIKAECLEYLQGTQVITDEEIVLRWIQAGKSGVNQSDFDNLSAEEKKEFCKDFLEKEYGAMVMINDEVELVDEAEDIVMIENTAEGIATHELPKNGVMFPSKERGYAGVAYPKNTNPLTPEDVDFLEAPLTEEEEF